jgi:hypothetical protein
VNNVRTREGQSSSKVEIIALPSPTPFRITPASTDRLWMNNIDSADHWSAARRASQGGWLIHNGQDVEIVWNGGKAANDVRVYAREAGARPCVVSQFGNGIVTWNLPFLFRLSPELILRLRGPTNEHKDGIFPIEQLLDADACLLGLSMSWRVTRIGLPIRFEADEPLCEVYPELRGLVEDVLPRIQGASDGLSVTKPHGMAMAEIPASRRLEEPANGGNNIHRSEVVWPLDTRATRPAANDGNTPFLIQSDFYDQASRLRTQFDRMFSTLAPTDPSANPLVYAYSQDAYQFLSASADRVFSADLVFGLLSRLRAWATESVGATHASTPRVQIYIGGSHRHVARDDVDVRWHYLISLTQSARRTRHINLVVESGHHGAQGAGTSVSRLAKIQLKFNELLVHDARQPYGVELAKGSVNPLEGMVLLDGYVW